MLLTFVVTTACFVRMSCSTQMLASKAAGAPNWFHPGSLTSGAQYSNTSPAMLARQAAYGTLAAAWHLYTGGRPAECFRLRWGDTGVPGAGKTPDGAWGWRACYGTSRRRLARASYMTNYHCKVSCVCMRGCVCSPRVSVELHSALLTRSSKPHNR
jgi:hypothetical protein